MIVDDLHVFGTSRRPAKTDPALVVHADTMLAGTVALERLESIAGRNAQIGEAQDETIIPYSNATRA